MADKAITIPKGWKMTTLGGVAEKIAMGPFGSNIKIETFVDEGVPVISGTHLNGHKLEDKDYNFITSEHADKLKSSIVFADDIIFTHAGNIGQVAYIPKNSKYKKYILSQRQFFLRPKKDQLQTEYLTYFFKTREGQHKLLANANQTGVPSIAQPASYLKSIEINLPPLPEQCAIAAVLSSLDDKIELLREQNKTLEATAQAIFKEWFVNFKFPGSTGKMIDSELGEIPEEWKVGRVRDVVAENTRGIAPAYSESGIPVINQRCVRNGTIIEEAIQYHDNSAKQAPAWAYLKPNDILINSLGVGTLGRISQVFLKREKDYLVHSCITILRANEEIIDPIILGYYFKSIESKIESMGTGTTGQTSLNNSLLGELKLVIPDKKIKKNYRQRLKILF